MLQERDDCADALIELSLGDLQAAQVATACRSAIRKRHTSRSYSNAGAIERMAKYP